MKTQVIETKFEAGDVVYLSTDIYQFPRVVIHTIIGRGGFIVYEVSSGTEVSRHAAHELSDIRNDELVEKYLRD